MPPSYFDVFFLFQRFENSKIRFSLNSRLYLFIKSSLYIGATKKNQQQRIMKYERRNLEVNIMFLKE